MKPGLILCILFWFLLRLPVKWLCWLGYHRPFFYLGHGVGGPCCFHCGKMLEVDATGKPVMRRGYRLSVREGV